MTTKPGPRSTAFAPLVLATSLLVACAQSEREPAPVVITPATPEAAMRPGTVSVEAGDTLYSISRRYNVSLRALIDANRLTPPYRLTVGQALALPTGHEYVVEKGDTLTSIARRHGMEVSALVRLNGVVPPYTIYPGQRLRLAPGLSPVLAPPMPAPSGAIANVPPVPPKVDEPKTTVFVSPQIAAREGQPAPARVAGSAATTARPPAHATSPVSAPSPAPGPATPAVTPTVASNDSSPTSTAVGSPPALHAAGFMWPVRGDVISSFGPAGKGQQNDGINIAVPRGEPVRAAEGGVVVYAGSEMKGFGNLLLIKHADGWMTAYAHNDALLVTRGATVERGQVVARAGSTGNVGEPQLHFEIRRGARAVDPTQFLRAGGA